MAFLFYKIPLDNSLSNCYSNYMKANQIIPDFICEPLFNLDVNLYLPTKLSYKLARVHFDYLFNPSTRHKWANHNIDELLNQWLDAVNEVNKWKAENNVKHLRAINCQKCTRVFTFVCDDANVAELKVLICGFCLDKQKAYLDLIGKIAYKHIKAKDEIQDALAAFDIRYFWHKPFYYTQ